MGTAVHPAKRQIQKTMEEEEEEEEEVAVTIAPLTEPAWPRARFVFGPTHSECRGVP